MLALLGLEQLWRVFLSLWEAGVTYLLLYSRIIFHPSISCWGLNEGDEYPGISLIMIKAFKVQVLGGVVETRRELRHLRGCWFNPRRCTRVSLLFFGCFEGHLPLLQHSPLFPVCPSTLGGISGFASPLAPLHMPFFLLRSGVHP